MLQQVPSVGRIVHYVSFGTPGGEYAPEHRAAIVTYVGEDMRVGLCVMNPTGLFFNENVKYDEQATIGGSWHWPEIVYGDHMTAFRRWLFGQSLSARCVRSALLTAIPLVTANGVLSLDIDVWTQAAVVAAAAALTPLVAALAVPDSVTPDE